MEECKKDGVLIAKASEEGNVLRIVGPLCLTQDDAKKVVQVMDRCIDKLG